MTNPARPQSQFVGVFSTEVQKLYAQVYQLANIQHGIAHSIDGYDEISLTGNFSIITNGNENIFSPEKLGLAKTNEKELHGGDTIDEAAGIFLSILEGKGTAAQNDVVAANAAFALQCYSPNKNIADCILLAKESLQSKKALQVFKNLFNR